jgi:ATP-dependent Lon protease
MTTLPVLALNDAVLLPGMVIRVSLDAGTQAAVDAARAAGDKTLLVVPRLDGDYATHGVTAIIEKSGRVAGSGEAAAVLRGVSRARIGSGVPGPGAALWVEAEILTESPVTGKTRELGRDTRPCSPPCSSSGARGRSSTRSTASPTSPSSPTPPGTPRG